MKEEIRNKRIEEYKWLVHATLKYWQKGRSFGLQTDFQDIIGAGYYGLVKAVDLFKADWNNDRAFKSFAFRYILGEMKMYFYTEDNKLSRRDQEKLQLVQKVNENKEHSIEDLEKITGLSEKVLLRTINLESIPVMDSLEEFSDLSEQLKNNNKTPEEELIRKEFYKQLEEELKYFSERDQIIFFRLLDGEQGKSIAKDFSFGAANVTNIKQNITKRLQKRLGG